jgi:hypothetical protein
MNFLWLCWLIWFGISLIARHYYRRNRQYRSLIMSDKRFLHHFILRPLFLLGDWNEKRNSEPRVRNETISISSMSRRLSDHFLDIPKKEEIAVPPGAKLVIHQSGIARRCEVCHQSDRFDAGTGLCQRCNHRTV